MAGVPGGFGILLKQMGFDPEQIKTSLTAARDEIMKRVDKLAADQAEIAASQKRIETLLYNIYSGEANGTFDGNLSQLPNGVLVGAETEKRSGNS